MYAEEPDESDTPDSAGLADGRPGPRVRPTWITGALIWRDIHEIYFSSGAVDRALMGGEQLMVLTLIHDQLPGVTVIGVEGELDVPTATRAEQAG